MDIQPVLLPLNGRNLVYYLSLFAIFLVLGSLYGDVGTLLFGHSWSVDLAKYLVGTSREGNISSFFSAVLLLMSACLLGMIYLFKKQDKDTFATQWLVLTLGFFLMSFDEAVSIHELMVTPMRKLLALQVYGVLYYAWVVPALVLVAGLALYFYRFMLHLPTQTCGMFVFSALLFLGGCIGFEMLGGWHVEQFGLKNLTYIAVVTLEESFEMAGIILFIHSLMLYMKKQNMRFNLQAI